MRFVADDVSISAGPGVSEEETRALALEEKNRFAREEKSSQELRFQLMETNDGDELVVKCGITGGCYLCLGRLYGETRNCLLHTKM